MSVKPNDRVAALCTGIKPTLLNNPDIVVWVVVKKHLPTRFSAGQVNRTIPVFQNFRGEPLLDRLGTTN